MRDFSSALSKLQVIARTSDWFITLLPPVLIGRSNYFGIGFSTVIHRPQHCMYYVDSRCRLRLNFGRSQVDVFLLQVFL